MTEPQNSLKVSGGGKLTANIMHFARALRAAGLPIGPGRVIDAVRAVEAVGLGNRNDFYWALHAVFVNRRDQRELFDQTFHLFWRNPRILERMMALILPVIPGSVDQGQRRISRRVAEAMGGQDSAGTENDEQRGERIEIDAALTYSADEHLRKKDFEDMTADEIALARQIIRRMRLPVIAMPTRRFQHDPAGNRISMRATLRAALRSGGDSIPLIRKRPRRRTPTLVILCDISGSMSRYSRMLLHFVHGVTNDRDRVFTFLFGTRLTNVTRHMREKDIDIALDRVAKAAVDWSGGTRIGACLHEFNRDWSRRVLGQGAVVLFISDGLDRDAAEGLDTEMERLHKSCRRLIWLNPLLRYDGFEAKAAGIRAIRPHVDDFRTIHNLKSLTQLADALSLSTPRQAEGVSRWQKQAA